MSDAGTDGHEDDKIRALHKRLLYTTIAIDYLHSSVQDGIQAERFKAKCQEYLKSPVDYSKENVKDLLSCLENKGFVSIGDYDILKAIVKGIHIDLIKEINKTELEIQNNGGSIKKRNSRGEVVEEEAEICHGGTLS